MSPRAGGVVRRPAGFEERVYACEDSGKGWCPGAGSGSGKGSGSGLGGVRQLVEGVGHQLEARGRAGARRSWTGSLACMCSVNCILRVPSPQCGEVGWGHAIQEYRNTGMREYGWSGSGRDEGAGSRPPAHARGSGKGSRKGAGAPRLELEDGLGEGVS